MVKSFFAYNLRIIFFSGMRFLLNHKGQYGASFKKKNLHIHDFTKSKIPYSWGIYDYYPQNEVFPEKYLTLTIFYL